jgi:hypothetical protein
LDPSIFVMAGKWVMYVRFVAASATDDPWRATGVITQARILRDEGQLAAFEVDLVESAFDWLNQHLPCPPFNDNLGRGVWTHNAVAWFRPEAKEPIARMWDLIAILKENGVAVQFFRSQWPGVIVYRDDFQVVAETPRRASR